MTQLARTKAEWREIVRARRRQVAAGLGAPVRRRTRHPQDDAVSGLPLPGHVGAVGAAELGRTQAAGARMSSTGVSDGSGGPAARGGRAAEVAGAVTPQAAIVSGGRPPDSAAVAWSPGDGRAQRVAAGLEQAVGLGGILPAAGAAVAAFEATPSEPPTAELLALLAGRGLRVLVPASGPERRTLAWTEIAPVTCALPVPGFEPTGAAVGPEALGECELVLVPALAVDRSGVRLGQGGGWYDRALRFADGGALRLAVCFADEVFAAGTLPAEPHDVLVHGALTAAGVELFD